MYIKGYRKRKGQSRLENPATCATLRTLEEDKQFFFKNITQYVLDIPVRKQAHTKHVC